MDSLLIAADTALRTLSGGSHAARACPRSPTEPPAMTDEERTLAAGEAVIAPSGESHGLSNDSGERAVLLVLMAPPPGKNA